MKNQKKLESLHDVIIENKKVFSKFLGGEAPCPTGICVGDKNGHGPDIVTGDKPDGTRCGSLRINFNI